MILTLCEYTKTFVESFTKDKASRIVEPLSAVHEPVVRVFAVCVQVVGDQVGPAMHPKVLGKVIVVKANYHRMNPLIVQLSTLLAHVIFERLGDDNFLPHLVAAGHKCTVWAEELTRVHVNVVPLLQSE